MAAPVWVRQVAGTAERAAASAVEAFAAAMALAAGSGALSLSAAQAAVLAALAAAVSAVRGALVEFLGTPFDAVTGWAWVRAAVERVVATFLVTALAAWPVAGQFDLSGVQAAAVAGGAAALAAAKAMLARYVGARSVALLPARLDPAAQGTAGAVA